MPRQDPSSSVPFIPSIPVSIRDVKPLLKALNGHGPSAADFNDWWQGGGLANEGVSYNIGPSPPDVLLSLANEQDYVTNPIWDVIGIINGTIPDEVIILGNHRDAWIAGGAGDPNSGSAALNEVVRSFGVALQQGWKPLRTIVFASWDGEEYGLIGSTEWVEEYLPWLSNSAVAYLNLDVGTTGKRFQARAAPLLNKAIHSATSLVPSPNQTIPGQTIHDLWEGHISTLGSGSDYTAFLDFAGISSTDFSFKSLANDPVYHYHSNYDSFHWMETFGDPGWHYHVAIARVWALLAANLVESPVIPFNATDYALALSSYIDSLPKLLFSSGESMVQKLPSFPTLSQSIASLIKASKDLDIRAATIADRIDANIPWWKWWQRITLYHEARQVNNRYKGLEREFLYQKGLDKRSWFKHVVYAPGYWTGYAGVTFPGLRESLEDGDAENAEVSEKMRFISLTV